MASNMIIAGSYDLRLVTLSILIAILAAYATLDLAGRVKTATRGARGIWLACGSVCMGTGIWAMHYVGMAADRLPVPVFYDWPAVALSLLVAIVASAGALYVVSRPTLSKTSSLAGSVFVGCGIAAMHYIGMEAMRLPAICRYSPSLVALSILLAIAIAYLAILIAFFLRENAVSLGWRKLGGAIVLGLAIPVMHYVSMAAATFIRMPSVEGSLAHAVPASSLGLASISTVAVMLLGLAVYSSATGRRLALQAQLLSENRSQVQTIFDNLKEGIIVLDNRHNVVQMNQAALRMLDLAGPPSIYAQMPGVFDVYLRDGTPLPREQWPSTLAFKGEYLQNCELEIRRKDKVKTIIVEVGTAPILDRFGQVGHIIISYRDITQPKQIDEARIRLAAIVESSEDAIIVKDIDGIITSWNAGAKNVFGYAAEEMIGQPMNRLLPIDRLDEEDEILNRIQRGETLGQKETMRKRKNGQFIHVSLTVTPIRDATGRIAGASEIARNISDRKQLESRLYESQKMEAIGQLTGGIAHDFNNLLSIVIGNLDLLERFVSSDEPALRRVQTAQKAASRGADLTRRLLAFSSREHLRPALVRIEEPLQNTLELAIRAIGPEINITTDFDPSIPPVFVDVAGLESAVLNLLVNARDAMPKGGNLTITTTQVATLEGEFDLRPRNEQKQTRYACVSISDTGDGMARETIDRAFEPFFTTKERGKGTGLGLAMVYGFFKQSGGAVRIDSELGYGTTVSFYLPLAQNATAQPPPPRAPAERKTLAPAHVLLVDDEADLLEIAHSYLAEIGITVLQARDGAEALEIVRLHPEVDVMVTDIVMPGGMNGVELSRQARALRPNLRFIYCSGFPAGALAEREMPPVDGPLLRKPYQRSDLIAAIRRTLLRRAATLERESST